MRFLLTAFLIALSTLGYTQNINKQAYERAIDYLNCRSSELSLLGDSTFAKACPCQDDISHGELTNFLQSKNATATISLSSEIDDLKKEYNPDLKTEEVIEFLTEGIFTNQQKYPRLYMFASKRSQNPDFIKFKNLLKKDFSVKFPSTELEKPKVAPIAADVEKKKEAPVTLQSLEDRVILLEYNLNSSKKWFDGFTFQIDVLALLFSLIVSILILYIVTKGRAVDESIPFKIKNYVREKIAESQLEYESAAAIHAEIRKLEEEVIRLRSEIKRLKNESGTV
jgi:hypothetical protein